MVIWVLQRFVWVLSFGLVVTALAGYTGRGGAWAERVGYSALGMVIYPAVTRRLASEEMMVRFTGSGDEHVLGLSEDFVKRFELQTVTPRPLREEGSGADVRLSFAAKGPPPHIVNLTLRPRASGAMETALTVDGGALPVALMILP